MCSTGEAQLLEAYLSITDYLATWSARDTCMRCLIILTDSKLLGTLSCFVGSVSQYITRLGHNTFSHNLACRDSVKSKTLFLGVSQISTIPWVT